MVSGLLIAMRARSRRFSIGALVVYLATAALLAFGHQCVHDLSRPAGARAAASGAHFDRAAATTAAHAACLACSLQRNTGGPALTPGTAAAPVFTAGTPLL